MLENEDIIKKVRFKNSIDMKFVLIPAGEFIMGDEENKPIHKVKIKKPFFMDIYPVTQFEWTKIMSSNPCEFKGNNLPVENVSWFDCQKFIEALNEKDDSNGYRLPTEAEWEYACRAGSKTRFSFGNDLHELHRYARFGGDWKTGSTCPVGKKAPNNWGLYDMHGNVWEWCEDWFGEYPSEEVTDPHGPKSGTHRIVRGGGWFGAAVFCGSTGRYFGVPMLRFGDLGFRIVRSL